MRSARPARARLHSPPAEGRHIASTIVRQGCGLLQHRRTVTPRASVAGWCYSMLQGPCRTACSRWHGASAAARSSSEDPPMAEEVAIMYFVCICVQLCDQRCNSGGLQRALYPITAITAELAHLQTSRRCISRHMAVQFVYVHCTALEGDTTMSTWVLRHGRTAQN